MSRRKQYRTDDEPWPSDGPRDPQWTQNLMVETRGQCNCTLHVDINCILPKRMSHVCRLLHVSALSAVHSYDAQTRGNPPLASSALYSAHQIRLRHVTNRFYFKETFLFSLFLEDTKMQYGYGMAETHQQQFMEGDSCSSLFSISTPQKQNQHHHLHYHHYHHPHLLPPPSPPQEEKQERQQQQQFFQLHPVPFTQQLLQQHHQFEAFQLQQQQQQQRRLHQQLRLEKELGGGSGGGGGGEGVGNGCGGGSGPSLPFFDFKLGLSENGGNREVVVNAEDGEEEHIPGSRPNSLEMPQCCWQSQQDGTIKEPFWKPLNGQLFDKKSTEEEKQKMDKVEANKKINVGQVLDKNLGNKYTFFGELEAICGGAGLGDTNQTGSGSALTGENFPRNLELLRPLPDPHYRNSGAATAEASAATTPAPIGVDHGSETSIGEEASLRKLRKRKRRKMKEELNSMAGFFESLVKQLMDHQEGLYRKFLEVVERIDQERIQREEEWRTQQIQSFGREATARSHEQALASSREAAIVSYLQKITGQTIVDLPKESIKINSNDGGNTNSRWPKAEVQALIQVRSSLEARFQEPGLKGPLWEEISTSMASMGYQRSAKRCKEKWENINKYFRKTKHNNKKKRSHPSKTCPYFHQLDQLYSRAPLYQNPSAALATGVHNLKGNNSELLDAIVAINDPQKVAPADKAEADREINDGDERENGEEGDQDMNNEDEDEDEDEEEEEGGGGDGDGD